MDAASIFFVVFFSVIILWVLIVRLRNTQFPGPGNRESKDPDYLTDQLLRKLKGRRSYYRDIYLKSEAWKRKRYVVLRRDNWKCVRCGAPATQVHHKRYAPRNIGKEPIEWLESVCKKCHEAIHA